MEPEDSLKDWTERVTELEDALQEAIKTIIVLQNAAEWTGAQRDEIQKKIDKLENVYLPF
jgi:hypothetical protein